MTSLAGYRRWILILGTITAIGPMSIDMYLPALPTMQAYFGVDTAAMQFTLSIYFLGLAVGQPLYGPMADRYGRRVLLLVGLAVYTLGSLVCALAPSIEMLSAGRLLQALGGCSGMVITRAMVRDRFEPEDTARIFAALVLVMGAAPVLAPLLGGQLLQLWGWHSNFIVLTLFGALCWVSAYYGLPETLQQRADPIRIGRVLKGYGALLVNRQFMGYALTIGLASAGMFSYISGAAFVFIDVFEIPPQHFGWYFGANAAGFVIVSQFNHYLLKRSSSDQLLRRAIRAFLGFGVLLLVMAITGIGGLWGVIVPLFLSMSALGLIYPNATAMALAPFSTQAGLASAAMGTLQFSMAAIGGAAVGHFHNGTAVPMAAVIAVCALLAALSLRTLTRPRRRSAAL